MKINKEVKIGVAGIVALFLLVYGINYLKGIHLFKPSSYFYVKFENVNGLSKSSPVFADGYPGGAGARAVLRLYPSGQRCGRD